MKFDFLTWEKASRDTIDVKRVYIDVTGDLVTGVLLSQIVYWFLPDDRGNSKLTIERDERLWLVKERSDWWSECRVSLKQFDRSIKILAGKNIVETKLYKYNGLPHIHIWLNIDVLSNLIAMVLNQSQNSGPQEGSDTKQQNVNPKLVKDEVGKKDQERGKRELQKRGNGNLPLGNSGIPQRAISSISNKTTNKDYLDREIDGLSVLQQISADISKKKNPEVDKSYQEQNIIPQLCKETGATSEQVLEAIRRTNQYKDQGNIKSSYFGLLKAIIKSVVQEELMISKVIAEANMQQNSPANFCGSKNILAGKKYSEQGVAQYGPYLPEFEKFYEVYPCKLEKRKAFKNFQTRLKEGVDPRILILAAQNYSKFCQKSGTKLNYIKHPATFIGSDKPYEDWIYPENLYGDKKEQMSPSMVSPDEKKKAMVRSLYFIDTKKTNTTYNSDYQQ